jgi:hypothetical protein
MLLKFAQLVDVIPNIDQSNENQTKMNFYMKHNFKMNCEKWERLTPNVNIDLLCCFMNFVFFYNIDVHKLVHLIM